MDGLRELRFPDGRLEVEDVVGIDLFLDGLKSLVVRSIVQRRGCGSKYSVIRNEKETSVRTVLQHVVDVVRVSTEPIG